MFSRAQTLTGNAIFVAVIEPINANAKLRIHTKPEKDDYSLPKILLRIVFEEIAVALSKNQVFLNTFLLISFSNEYKIIRLHSRYIIAFVN